MEAIANYNFQATDNEELSFCKGQIVKILEFDIDEHWYNAELDGNEGFVPKNRLTCSVDGWFVGRLSSHEVITRLQQRSLGHFMIRHSQTVPGDYALTVREGPSVVHYRIRKDRGNYSVWEMPFKSLNDLVAYYKCNSISRTSECKLQDGEDDRKVFYAQAVYDFAPTDVTELPLRVGDVVRVTSRCDPGWWEGIANGRKGVFPSNYVVSCHLEGSGTHSSPSSPLISSPRHARSQLSSSSSASSRTTK